MRAPFVAWLGKSLTPSLERGGHEVIVPLQFVRPMRNRT
jgi:hypothetical protein